MSSGLAVRAPRRGGVAETEITSFMRAPPPRAIPPRFYGEGIRGTGARISCGGFHEPFSVMARLVPAGVTKPRICQAQRIFFDRGILRRYFHCENHNGLLGSSHGVPNVSPLRRCAAPRPRACGRPGRRWTVLIFIYCKPLKSLKNRQRNLWKSLERNSLDLEMLGKKLGAVVIHYRKLYFSLNSPTCAGVSGRIGSERSIRGTASSAVCPPAPRSRIARWRARHPRRRFAVGADRSSCRREARREPPAAADCAMRSHEPREPSWLRAQDKSDRQ